jgi:hypothetical protein
MKAEARRLGFGQRPSSVFASVGPSRPTLQARHNQVPSKIQPEIQPLDWNKRMVRIEAAQPLSDYRLKVRFNDGLEGIYPVEAERRGGVLLTLPGAETEAELQSPMALREGVK